MDSDEEADLPKTEMVDELWSQAMKKADIVLMKYETQLKEKNVSRHRCMFNRARRTFPELRMP